LRSNLICRGIFEDFHAGSKGNLYSKIATPRTISLVFVLMSDNCMASCVTYRINKALFAFLQLLIVISRAV